MGSALSDQRIETVVGRGQKTEYELYCVRISNPTTLINPHGLESAEGKWCVKFR
jgi:hypothetical protein